MARVTYIGEPPARGSFVWHGIEFSVGVPVETDNADLLRQAGRNRFFVVEEDAAPLIDGAVDTPFERGAKAAIDGKKRSIPPSYRAKPEGEEWLSGYDKAAG